MTNLETRKTKLQFLTASTVRDRGTVRDEETKKTRVVRLDRPIAVRVDKRHMTLWLHGTRKKYTIPIDAIFDTAVKIDVESVRKQKAKLKPKKVKRGI